MNEQQLAAVKQALEALENATTYGSLTGADWVFDQVENAITALQFIISQDALDKKADNARELGLSYDDEPKIGCVNHDCDKCRAVQEPVAWRNAALRVGEDLCSVGPFGYYDMTAEQWLDWALGVVTVHAPPAAPVQEAIVPKPWVNLTIDELLDLEGKHRSHEDLSAAIKAKLKEKNQ